MKKRVVSLLLTLCMVLALVPVGTLTASAASSYNSSKALAYAKAHWNDGVGLCAEFVSNCLKAGGLSSWSRECTGLYNQLYKEVVDGSKIATVQYLTASGNYIKTADNKGKIAAGDVILWHCKGCPNDKVGGPYQHTALISDVSGTYVKVYQHNSAMNNETTIWGSCYECGRRYSDVVVIHFGSSNTPDPAGDIFFDADIYYALYPDLANAFGKNPEKLYSHWLNYGKGEGRVASLLFDAEWYLQQNPDVAKALGAKNYAAAYEHFTKYGLSEGRSGSPFFNAKFYLDRYKDLTDALGYDCYKAAWHFAGWGVNEERTASSDFSIETYSKTFPEIAKKYPSIKDRYIYWLKADCSMSFSPGSVTLNPGDSRTVSIKFSGNGIYTMRYYTSDTNVCTASWGSVDWGGGTSSLSVTGHNPGSANITVKFEDSDGNSFYAQSFNVKVNSYTTKVTVNSDSVNLNLATKPSEVVTATVSGSFPNDANINFSASGVAKGTWFSTKVENNQAKLKIYADETGNGKITFKVSSGSGVLATATVNVTATAPTYTVTYDANGGSGAPSKQTKNYNKPLTLSSTKPTRTGYQFNGWATSSGATSASYQPGSKYTTDKNLTLYAVWAPADGVKYTVKHYLQDGDSRRLADTDTLTGTTGKTVTPTPREYPGYSTPSKQSATVKSDGSTVIEYVYTIKTYSVTLRAGTGIDKVIGGGSYHYGDTVTVNAEVADGYDWYQWAGSAAQVQGSVEQRFSFTMPDEDVTLEATATKQAHQHDLAHTAAKKSTETAEGNTEYWYCADCGKYFADADATKEIKLGDTVLERLEHVHDLTHYPAVGSTCDESGRLEYWFCEKCEKYFSNAAATQETAASRVALKALGHNYVDGECTRCGAADPDYTAPEPEPVVDPVHFEKQTLYYQGQFTDVSAGQWFTQNVAEAYELGLMKGTGEDVFDPYGEVTLAQAITMAARVHSIYDKGYEDFDQSGGKWYQVYLDYAYQNGIISWAYYNADVERKATRAQFAEIFASALPEEALGAINTVSDNAIPDVSMSDACASYVYTLYRAGVLTGGDANGTFSPQTYITRAEAAAIVSRMAESDNRVSFTLR